MKIKRVIEDLIFFKFKTIIIVKIYLGISLELLRTVWGQFIFRQFLDLAYISSQDLQAPSYVVSANYRVLICCTCHFQGGSLCFSCFCLLVFSVSNFCSGKRGRWQTLFQAQLISRAVGREGRCKQITLVCVRIVSATPGLPCSRHVCFPCLHCLGSRLLCKELSEAGPGLYALPMSKLLRFRYSGTPQRCRLGWPCVLCPSRSKQLR